MHVTENRTCPQCGHKIDAASCTTEDVSPKAGDYSICVYCTSYLVFTDDSLNVRLLTVEDLETIDNDVFYELTKARNVINKTRKLLDDLFNPKFADIPEGDSFVANI